MPSEDYYYTVAAPVRAPELKVKGSRFIADVAPVRSKEEIEGILVRLRKEFYDATHHCFAYRLGPEGLLLRAADDGEPSGTAGKPILLILTSQQLTDTLIVVTRYYGGTNLGTGGLARAYAESAQLGVAAARIERIYLKESRTLRAGYEDLPGVERLIHVCHGEVTSSEFAESVTLHVRLRRSEIEGFQHKLIDLFHGRVGCEPATE